MTLERAIDDYLRWRQLERDAPPGSVKTYYDCLVKFADAHPRSRLHEWEGRDGTDRIRAVIARHWGTRAASTRANRISIAHAFWDWLEQEDLMETNPARRIKCPPARRPNVYRPDPDELARIRAAATNLELPAILLLEGVGLRASECVSVRWADVDLLRGRLRVKRKGGSWQTLPLVPDVTAELRRIYRDLQPQLDHHLYTVRERRWANATHQLADIRDPTRPAARSTLGYMVARVSKRAGLREMRPHALRHGFATRLRRQGKPVDVVQFLLGHQRIETTKRYLDELRLEEVEAELADRGGRNPASLHGPARILLEGEPSREARSDEEGSEWHP